MAKIEGTNKFIIYFYNGKNVRNRNPANAKHFVYRQWGRIFQVDENGNKVGQGYPFTSYGEMLTFINKIMMKSVRRNL